MLVLDSVGVVAIEGVALMVSVVVAPDDVVDHLEGVPVGVSVVVIKVVSVDVVVPKEGVAVGVSVVVVVEVVVSYDVVVVDSLEVVSVD